MNSTSHVYRAPRDRLYDFDRLVVAAADELRTNDIAMAVFSLPKAGIDFGWELEKIIPLYRG